MPGGWGCSTCCPAVATACSRRAATRRPASPPAFRREDVLIEKCLGRRLCSKCGKNWNVADIWRPATGGQAEVRMPPLSPPAQCAQFMTTRSDDTEEVVRHRLRVYQASACGQTGTMS